MKVKVAINNSTAVLISKLGLFPKLMKQIDFIITEEIKKEIEQGVKEEYRDAVIRMNLINEGKIKIVIPKTTTQIIKDYGLKKNDASVIALANEKKILITTEDKTMFNIAIALNLTSVNLIFFIKLLYKKKKLNAGNIQTLIDLLNRYRYNKENIDKLRELI